MFRGVISREHGEPWGLTGMTSALWLGQPVRRFRIDELVATQAGVLFDGLLRPEVAPVGGDDYPHVIVWNGSNFLEDGHHRAVRRLIAGRRTIEARWLRVGGEDA